MKEEIKQIIDSFKSGIEGDGGGIELQDISAEGVVYLKQKENPMTNIGAIWTHRIRVERAIKAKFPDLQVNVELQP